jgi:hypothetical protein
LHSENTAHAQWQIRHFPISTSQSFHAFRLKLTGNDSSGDKFICMDSIEVFGYVTDLAAVIGRGFTGSRFGSASLFLVFHFVFIGGPCSR